MLLIFLQDCWVQQTAFVKQPSHIEQPVSLHMQLIQNLQLHLHSCWDCCAEYGLTASACRFLRAAP